MLARTRRVLMLTAALAAGLELRAAAQSDSPVAPVGADPAALLLAPVLPHSVRAGDLPIPPERVKAEPAARLAPVGEAGIVRLLELLEDEVRHRSYITRYASLTILSSA